MSSPPPELQSPELKTLATVLLLLGSGTVPSQVPDTRDRGCYGCARDTNCI